MAGTESLALLDLVATPVIQNWQADPTDIFPLSYYPMFASDKSERQRFDHLVGVDGQGNRRPLEFSLAGTGGMNQVRRQIRKMVAAKQSSKLCQSVAARVARAGKNLDEVVQVRVVTGSYRMSELFAGKLAPESEDVRDRCMVQRG